MESDLNKNTYITYKELEGYMYGSAEVIGLMMSCILDLPLKAHPYAALQGKAMQLLNFIRDIQEDNDLNRQYIPSVDMKKYGVFSLKSTDDHSKNKAFNNLMKYQLKRYYKLQTQAEKGYHFIPRRYLIPIKTAAQMYKYTANILHASPQVVFQKKVKPSVVRIITTGIKNIVL
jgi:15-cis-phytoene synthase